MPVFTCFQKGLGLSSEDLANIGYDESDVIGEKEMLFTYCWPKEVVKEYKPVKVYCGNKSAVLSVIGSHKISVLGMEGAQKLHISLAAGEKRVETIQGKAFLKCRFGDSKKRNHKKSLQV